MKTYSVAGSDTEIVSPQQRTAGTTGGWCRWDREAHQCRQASGVDIETREICCGGEQVI
jgi:hypothetical protein